MLDLAILGLLRDLPRHGYELKHQLGALGFWQVSFGSLYPALRRLEKRGLIEALRVTGRRKAYQLTAEGRNTFQGLLDADVEAPEPDRHFNLRLAFFRYLDPAARIRALQGRRRELVTALGTARRTLRDATAPGEQQDRYTRALMERSVSITQSDIAWLDELIAAERATQPGTNERTGPAWAQ